jgi:F-type H+-transporting ATPase subunit b
MESLGQSCAKRSAKKYCGVLWILLTVSVVLPNWTSAQHAPQANTPPAEARGGEHHVESPLAIVWKWGNFFILFGGLGWYLRRPLQEFLNSRTKAIEQGLASGRQARETAARKLSEIEARLAQLDKEIKELKDQALKEAEEERGRILENAKLESERILELARREIKGLEKSARLELKSHVAQLSVKLAEERLRSAISSEADKRIINQFLQTLESAKN